MKIIEGKREGSMNIEIENVDKLLEDVAELNQENQNLLSMREELLSQINTLNNAWDSTAADKESYLSGINTNLEKVNSLITVTKQMAGLLEHYGNEQKHNAS